MAQKRFPLKYWNLLRLMSQNSIARSDVAEMLGISYLTVQNKLNGRSDFSISEAKKIRAEFFPNEALDSLFKKE